MINKKGFTLIELLVVIGILAVLLAITLIAVNPAQNIADAEDTQRRSDITQILNAVSQYVVDNNGSVAGLGITGDEAPIGNGTDEIDLCTELVPRYIAALPQDPTVSGGNGVTETECATPYSTGYTISVLNGRVTVYAPNANDDPIEVTR